MAVKIGHASIDENGKISGGKAGDQTKREVCTRTWYEHKHGWDCVLRPKNATMAEKSAKFVEKACANNNVGYDQYQRNTLHAQAKAVGFDASKITVKCECDCSSLMHVAAISGGAYLVYGSNGYTTRTMRNGFRASGDYEVLTDKKYLTTDKHLKRGDILVAEGHHTIMILENGSGVASDKLEVDGEWGKATTRKSQEVLGTVVDGIVSNQPESCKKYVPNAMTTSWEFEEEGFKNGSALIKAIQKLVGLTGKDIDGHCGKDTVTAMQKFLTNKGFNVGAIDGIMGEKTVKAWQQYINSRL